MCCQTLFFHIVYPNTCCSRVAEHGAACVAGRHWQQRPALVSTTARGTKELWWSRWLLARLVMKWSAPFVALLGTPLGSRPQDSVLYFVAGLTAELNSSRPPSAAVTGRPLHGVSEGGSVIYR
ncbi:hypothetical protein E2C01_012631 [Portunus trituberculatus]|uniref:Uncharacterized protein n=1 Tax=Portunus trituberculatus TaxID=210409 RepID=A0A5B7DF85_PORTR|nr:hypothetical protein [Portunus trituberculatus]